MNEVQQFVFKSYANINTFDHSSAECRSLILEEGLLQVELTCTYNNI